ncbi:Endo/exonuclease/phosphatase domain-containing protein [Aphelenchoides bicaudatus]|nr:Endo/exonuclease/phosphatase domain-containing protein [Aphelenchoides bicaudatus]
MRFHVATLNCWLLPYAYPIGSKDRPYRLERLAEALKTSDYDVISLQELWSENDYTYLATELRNTGFTGSGTCVFSAHKIVSSLMHRYSLNGFAHHVHRGDWFGGKIVGMVELDVHSTSVALYVTHLHAEYNRENDIYLPHRISQAFELAQFVRHTSRTAGFVVLTGDFNIEPEDLGYSVIRKIGNLFDAWDNRPNVEFRNGMTCDRPDNCYTASYLLKASPDGKRLDYVMYQSGTKCLKVVECTTCFNVIPESRGRNYSDHVGVRALFEVQEDNSGTGTCPIPIATHRQILENSLSILAEGEVRVLWDRRLFLAMMIIGLFSLIITLNIESVYPFLWFILQVVRILITLFIGFCSWHGFIGLTIELKSLKETKQTMENMLEDDDLPTMNFVRRSYPFAKPVIQRFEKPVPKLYYAPEWNLTKKHLEDQEYSPKYHNRTTPEKWDYQNKVVWPANYVVPETGRPKPVEVFHCEQSFHYAPRKIWYACQFIWRMKVDDALLQLKFKGDKACLILTTTIEKAMERATKEFHINDPSKMFIAEAFAIQDKIIKSRKRHAREVWHFTRHRFIHVFVRLEEGPPPNYKGAKPLPNGWEHMDNYMNYLRDREMKPLL